MLIMDKLLIMIIQTKRAKTKLLLLCLVLKFLFKPKGLLLNNHFLVLILNQVHCHCHHHHRHLLYHTVSVEMLMIAVVIESNQSLGIAPYLDLGLPLQVKNLQVVIIIMKNVHILVGRWKNSSNSIIVIDISILLQHLKFQINNNLVLCLHYPTIVSVFVSFMCVCF